MKKLLCILPVFFLILTVNAQLEDEVYIGKTFGKYNGRGIIIPDTDRNAKPVEGQTTITGKVVSVSPVTNPTDQRGERYSFNLQKADGTIITVGTRDNGFTVPKGIVGKTITVQGKDAGQISGLRDPSIKPRRDVNAQQDIQFAATGIKVIE